MNEKEKEGENTRTFSLSTPCVEKPPLLFEYFLAVLIHFFWLFERPALVLQRRSEKMVFVWGPPPLIVLLLKLTDPLRSSLPKDKYRLLDSCYRGFCDSIDSFHGNIVVFSRILYFLYVLLFDIKCTETLRGVPKWFVPFISGRFSRRFAATLKTETDRRLVGIANRCRSAATPKK